MLSSFTLDTVDTEVVFVCYANPVLFPPKDDDEFIDSIIISATVGPDDPNKPELTPQESVTVTDTSMMNDSIVSDAPNMALPTEEARVARDPVIIEVATTEKVSKQVQWGGCGKEKKNVLAN